MHKTCTLKGPAWIYSPENAEEDQRLAKLGLVVAGPVMAAAAMAIWFDGGRPIFYTEKRQGRDRKLFDIHKMRTLPVGIREGIPGRGPRDDRATRVGKVLRLSAVDEVPQLYDILMGNMSFHGHRAINTVDENATYDAMRGQIPTDELDFWFDEVRPSPAGLIDDFSLIAHTIRYGSLAYHRKRVKLETHFYNETSHEHNANLRLQAAGRVAKRIAGVFHHGLSEVAQVV